MIQRYNSVHAEVVRYEGVWMKKVYSNNNVALVWHVKNMLEQQSIDVVTRNDRLYSIAGEIPVTECMGEVWVVNAVYYKYAERLVKEMEKPEPEEIKDWTCDACGEHIAGTFAVCWNCQSVPGCEPASDLT